MPGRSENQTDFDFLKEACAQDTRSELAHLIATARRYGIGDPELMTMFVAILKGPQQSTTEQNPLGLREPRTGEPRSTRGTHAGLQARVAGHGTGQPGAAEYVGPAREPAPTKPFHPAPGTGPGTGDIP
jgi:hypothetical protein